MVSRGHAFDERALNSLDSACAKGKPCGDFPYALGAPWSFQGVKDSFFGPGATFLCKEAAPESSLLFLAFRARKRNALNACFHSPVPEHRLSRPHYTTDEVADGSSTYECVFANMNPATGEIAGEKENK